MAGLASRLRDVARQQGKVVPLLRERVGQALAGAWPLFRRMAERLRQKREQEQQERELEMIRAQLLRERMAGWQRAQARDGRVRDGAGS